LLSKLYFSFVKCFIIDNQDIPHQNRCIEVKSTWTYKKKEDNVFIKQQAVLDAGYSCEIWVYSDRGKRLEIHKKPPN